MPLFRRPKKLELISKGGVTVRYKFGMPPEKDSERHTLTIREGNRTYPLEVHVSGKPTRIVADIRPHPMIAGPKGRVPDQVIEAVGILGEGLVTDKVKHDPSKSTARVVYKSSKKS